MHSNLEVWSWVLNQHASIPLGYWCFIMFQKKIYWTEMFCALSDQLLLLCKSQTFLFSFSLDHRWRNFIKQQKRLLQECEFSMPVLKYCKSIKKINHIFISIRILEQHFCKYLRKRNKKRYYMAARRYEISLRVLKNYSRVTAANEWNIFFNTRRKISYLQATT